MTPSQAGAAADGPRTQGTNHGPCVAGENQKFAF